MLQKRHLPAADDPKNNWAEKMSKMVFLLFWVCILEGCATKSVSSPETLTLQSETKIIKTARFEQLTMETLSEAQKPLANELVKAFKGGGLKGPFNVFLRSPECLAIQLEEIKYFKERSPLSSRIQKLATLIVARYWNSQYLWSKQAPRALEQGISASAIDDIRNGRKPNDLKADEAAVYFFCVELLRYHTTKQDTFNSLRKLFSEIEIADLLSLLSSYNLVSMTLIASDTTIDDPPLPIVKSILPIR